jgi:exopolysaccharide production protein ExoQ
MVIAKFTRRRRGDEIRTSIISRWHYFAAVFFLTNSIQAFDILDRLVYGEWLGKPGDKITQSLNLLMIASSLALFARGFRRLRTFRTGAVLALGMAGFLLSSAAWSVNLPETIRQGVIYLFMVIGVCGIAGTLEVDEFMKLLAIVCGLAAAACLLLMVVSPSNAYGGSGDFRGIFSQKNILGEAMTVGALAGLHGLRAGKRGRWRNGLILAIVMLVAVFSKSATSLLTIFAFCAVDRQIALLRKGGLMRLLAIVMAFIGIPILICVAIFPDSLLEMIGKDPTLTGRTVIWSYVIPDIYQKPLLGWGYAAFWSPGNPAAMEIADAIHWFAPEAHNGLLEILLTVGVVGAALFIFLLARTIGLALRCLRAENSTLAISTLLCCIGIILVGISEMVLLGGLQASTPVFFATGLYCERAIRLRRRRRSAASCTGIIRISARKRVMA